MRAHTPEKRQAALADVPDLGISGAAKKHQVGKASLSKWCADAGIRTDRNERTGPAIEAAAARNAERRTEVVERLWEIADRASRRELELLEASDLRSVVGARTRAIHDAELLAGRATGRTETIEPLDAEIARLVEEMRAAT